MSSAFHIGKDYRIFFKVILVSEIVDGIPAIHHGIIENIGQDFQEV